MYVTSVLCIVLVEVVFNVHLKGTTVIGYLVVD